MQGNAEKDDRRLRGWRMALKWMQRRFGNKRLRENA